MREPRKQAGYIAYRKVAFCNLAYIGRMKQVPVWCLVAALMFLPGSRASSTAVHPVPKPDIVIDIGHGGVDGGTSYESILEKDINLGVGLKLYPVLRRMGLASSFTRTQDYALSDDNKWLKGGRHKRDLAQRVEIANRLKPAFMLSLHVNWANDRSKRGPLVIYQKDNAAGMKLAQHFQEELNVLYGTTTAPEPAHKYYLLRHSLIPAVIIEMGYLSNSMDRGLLTSTEFQKKLAETIGQASAKALQDSTLDPSARLKP